MTAYLGKSPGHAFGHFGRRSDGEPREKATSGCNASFGTGRVAVNEMFAC